MAKEEAEKWRKHRKTSKSSYWRSLGLGCDRSAQSSRHGHNDDSDHAKGCK